MKKEHNLGLQADHKLWKENENLMAGVEVN